MWTSYSTFSRIKGLNKIKQMANANDKFNWWLALAIASEKREYPDYSSNLRVQVEVRANCQDCMLSHGLYCVDWMYNAMFHICKPP